MGESCVGAESLPPRRTYVIYFLIDEVAAAALLPAGFVFFHAERFFFAGFVFRNRVHFVAL
jgi:hypothetical protein